MFRRPAAVIPTVAMTAPKFILLSLSVNLTTRLGTRRCLMVLTFARRYTLHTSTMHNPIQAVDDPLYRRLSYAYVQSLAMSMLVVPIFLSHEHNALQALSSFTDVRVGVIVVVVAAVVAMFIAAFTRRSGGDTVTDVAALGAAEPSPDLAANRRARIVAGVLLTFVPFVPASHVRCLWAVYFAFFL